MNDRTARSALRWSALGALAALGTAPLSAAAAPDPVPAAAGAQAQPDPADPAAANADGAGIEEFVVRARKREENALDVPLSIAAFSAERLADLDVRRANELSGRVANLQFDGATGSSQVARIHLRGIGSSDTIATSDPSVGVYLDGVYLARGHGAMLAISDLDHVEVVRGPQGTLFGKNSAGGVIQIFTRPPLLDEHEGYVQLRAGNFNRFDTRFGINLPLVPEQSALRLSFATATRDGFFDNTGRGPEKLGDDKTLAGRAQLLMQPSADSELRLSLERSRERRTPRGSECVVSRELDAPVPPAATKVPPYLAPLRRLHQACRASAEHDIDQVSTDLSFTKEHLDGTASTLSWNWDIADGVTFRSITAWRRQDYLDRVDLDGTRESVGELDSIDAGHERQDQVSQELQWLGEGLQGRLHYVFGLYALREKVRDQGHFGVFVDTPLLPEVGAAPIQGALRGQRLKLANQSYASFFHSTYDVNERWSVDLGVRRTQERKQLNRLEHIEREGIYADPCANKPLAAPVRLAKVPFTLPNGTVVLVDAPVATASPTPLACSSFDHSVRYSDWSPLARLSWRPAENLHLYAGWSRGFKSGGFNGRADDPLLFPATDDETVNSYEIGFKGSWFDGALHLATSVFYAIHEDIQRTIPTTSTNGVGVGIVVINAGEAELSGGELELAAQLAPGLQLRSSLGVLNGRYTKFRHPGNPNAEDAELQFAPPYTLGFELAYEHPLPAGGSLRLQGDWSHVGAYAIDAANSPMLLQGKHGELGAQLIWSWADDRTELVLWGANLFDRRYLVNGINFGDSFGTAIRYYSDPRTYGAEVRRRF